MENGVLRVANMMKEEQKLDGQREMRVKSPFLLHFIRNNSRNTGNEITNRKHRVAIAPPK